MVAAELRANLRFLTLCEGTFGEDCFIGTKQEWQLADEMAEMLLEA